MSNAKIPKSKCCICQSTRDRTDLVELSDGRAIHKRHVGSQFVIDNIRQKESIKNNQKLN